MHETTVVLERTNLNLWFFGLNVATLVESFILNCICPNVIIQLEIWFNLSLTFFLFKIPFIYIDICTLYRYCFNNLCGSPCSFAKWSHLQFLHLKLNKQINGLDFGRSLTISLHLKPANITKQMLFPMHTKLIKKKLSLIIPIDLGNLNKTNYLLYIKFKIL